jgi:hypothetical protein
LHAAAIAGATPRRLVTVEAPREVADDATRDAALDEIVELGASGIRVLLPWRDVAPVGDSPRRPSFDATDPDSYQWDRFDRIVDAAMMRGLKVLLSVSSPVPMWATAGRADHVTAPSASEFGSFMTAVGRHYGGQITAWLIWNEPNHSRFLRPQRRRGRVISPRLYRRLYLAAHAGLRRAGRGRDRVVTGEIAPSSDAMGVRPVQFLRGMLCLDPRSRPVGKCRRLPADGLGVHPYGVRGPRPGPQQVTITTLPRLTSVLDRAARAGRIAPRVPLYITEFGVQSFPDRYLGLPAVDAAALRSIAEWIAFRNRRVQSFSQYLLRDDADLGDFQSGLRYSDGRKKPSYEGFRLPLVVRRQGRQAVLWGLVRPTRGPTTVRVERSQRPGAWNRHWIVRTRPNGTWTLHTSFVDGGRWRVIWTSPTGERHVGPPTHAYRCGAFG